MNSEDSLLFATPANSFYDINYEKTTKKVIPKLESFVLPQDLDKANNIDSYKDYAFLCEQWENQILTNSEDVILPIPLGLSFRYPSSPHIPTPEEKKSTKKTNTTFDAKRTPLYPENYLYMLDFIMKKKRFSADNPYFPKEGIGRNGEELIPIENHIRSEKPWYAHTISVMPNPIFYKTYESYKQAMLNWHSANQLQINFIRPAQMEQLLKVPIQNQTQNPSKTKQIFNNETYQKIDDMYQKHYSQYASIKPKNTEKMKELIQDLFANTKKKSQKATKDLDIDFPDKYEIAKVIFGEYGRVPKQFALMAKQSKTMMSNFIRESAKLHRNQQLFLFFQLIKFFNDKKNGDRILVLNKFEELEECARLINHFSPQKQIFIKSNLKELQKLFTANDPDSIFIICAYKALLEQHYTFILLNYFVMYSNNKVALQLFKERYKKLSEQTNNYLTIGLQQIINWILSNKQDQFSFPIVVDFLYLISHFSQNAKIYFNLFQKELPFLLNKMAIASPTSFFKLKVLTFLSSKLMKLLFDSLIPGLDSIFFTRLSTINKSVIEFISILFNYRQSTSNLIASSVQLLSKSVQIITSSEFSDNTCTKSYYFELIYHITKFMKRNCIGKSESETQQFISQTLSVLISAVSCLPNNDSLAYILDSIKILTVTDHARLFVKSFDMKFQFIFDIIQKNTLMPIRTKIMPIAPSASSPTVLCNSPRKKSNTLKLDDFNYQDTIPSFQPDLIPKNNDNETIETNLIVNNYNRERAYRLLAALLLKHKHFRKLVSNDGIFHNEFCQILEAAPLMGQLSLVKFAISFVLNQMKVQPPTLNMHSADNTFTTTLLQSLSSFDNSKFETIGTLKSIFDINVFALAFEIFEADNEQLDKMFFSYKYQLNSMMNNLIVREDELAFPKQFFVFGIIRMIMACKELETSRKRGASTKIAAKTKQTHS